MKKLRSFSKTEWREKNREEINQKQKIYREKNREEINRKARERYHLELEKSRKRGREKYHKDPEKHKESTRKSREKNKEKWKEYQKLYRKENIEKEKERGKIWYDSQDKELLYQKRKARQIELGHGNYYDRPERCFKMYKRNARNRKYKFLLTLREFSSFWQLPCFYCGAAILTIGIDRLINSIGYQMDNVVACCKSCNFMKGKQDLEEFLGRCLEITNRHIKTGEKSRLSKDQRDLQKLIEAKNINFVKLKVDTTHNEDPS